MIYFDSVSSLIECEYLEESIENKASSSDIFVNPTNVKYIIGKVIIINSVEYDYKKYIPTLLNNKCKVISRIKLSEFEDSVDFQPYILKICPEVLWNGKIADISSIDSLNGFLDEGLCDFELTGEENYLLYFPKLDISAISEKIKPTDSSGNLTGFGWALQQVGVNVIKDTPFRNLDIIKSGKIVFD